MRRVVIDGETLVKLVRRCRERWRDCSVDRIVYGRSKQLVYINVNGIPVKLIVYFDGRLRAYSGRAPGTALAVKRIAERVLGLDRGR